MHQEKTYIYYNHLYSLCTVLYCIYILVFFEMGVIYPSVKMGIICIAQYGFRLLINDCDMEFSVPETLLKHFLHVLVFFVYFRSYFNKQFCLVWRHFALPEECSSLTYISWIAAEDLILTFHIPNPICFPHSPHSVCLRV